MDKILILDGDPNIDVNVDGESEIVVAVGHETIVHPIEITENGHYEPESGVDGFLRVDVDVKYQNLIDYINNITGSEDTNLSDAVESLVAGYSGGSSEEELLLKVLDRTISGDVTINSITTLGYQAFAYCSELRKISLPNCIIFNSGYVFNGCSNIEEYYLPKISAINGQQVFVAPKVKCVVLPSLQILTNNCFYASNAQLEKVDMLGGGLIRNGNFRNYSKLSLLIFRNTSSITTLNQLNDIETTKFGANGSGGTLYVPQALISSYQADSKWSTILGYTNNRILPIEGSEYDLYYADGSLIETY